jgi:hypothetical protein
MWAVEVATSVRYMAMSLDGYIASPNDEPGNPGGVARHAGSCGAC